MATRRPSPLLLASAAACALMTLASHPARAADDTQRVTAPPATQFPAPGTLPEIVTTGHQQTDSGFTVNSASIGPLGSRKLQDLPYSVNVVDSTIIRNQHTTNLYELLKYMPSTQMEARGGMEVGRPQSRGMEGDVVSNNRLNDLNISGTTAYPMEMLERVEVINGLSGALYGPANPAGSFNLIQKRPTDAPLRELTFGYRNRSAFKAHADLGDRIGPSGAMGYRVNLMKEKGTGYVKHSDLDRQLGAIALDFRLSAATVVELNGSRYDYDKYGYPTSFSYGTDIQLPSAPSARKVGFGQPYSGMQLRTTTGSMRVRHQFSEDWKLEAAYGRQIADRYMPTAGHALLDIAGNYSSSIRSTMPGRFTVNSNLLRLNGRLTAAGIQHEVFVSTTGYNWKIYSTTRGELYRLGNASLAHPVLHPEPAGVSSRVGSRYYGSNSQVQSFSVGDTLTFTPQWSAMLVASRAHFKSNSYNQSGTRTGGYDENGFSGAASVSYKPQENLTTYLGWADSLQAGGVAGRDTANEGQTLLPIRSKQYELGARYQLAGMSLSATLFDLRRPFAFAGDDNVYRVQGLQHNRGLELYAQGNVGDDWSLLGGVTFLNARLKDSPDATTSGKHMVGVPKVQASLLAEYRMPQVSGLTLGSSVRYVGRREINTRNTASAKGYYTLDLSARYETRLMGSQTTWRLGINNVTDQKYWASFFPGSIDGRVAAGSALMGDPRAFIASVTMAF